MAGPPARCVEDVRAAKARLRSLGDESSLTAELLASRAAYAAASLLLARAFTRPAPKKPTPDATAPRGTVRLIASLVPPVLLPAIMNMVAAFVAARPPRAPASAPAQNGDSVPTEEP